MGQEKAEQSEAIWLGSRPGFELSPYLYMQFMEPLGTTDGSVAAAWDFIHGRWRRDVLDMTRELGPTLIRWGGCFSSYYRWKEGVGPRRKPMVNLLWGGVETNDIGTHEFVDFCRLVGADPLICVNFESDGRQHLANPGCGEVRSAGPGEAAEWVDYCNNPRNEMRRRHGIQRAYGVRLWQIGNETSYGGGYNCETAARRTLAFARAMRRADPAIELIGWGDSGWAPRMLEVAGEELDYVAFHHMFNPDGGVESSPLTDTGYRRDPERTWVHLMRASEVHEARIREIREQVSPYGKPLALTECHLSLPGRNRCELLSSWAAGVAYARMLNAHERNGDLLKIATLADFCGTRWQTNAIMIPMPRGRPYMMPVARVMGLYRKHSGKRAVQVLFSPPGLDVTASRTRDSFFIHVVNTDRTKSVQVRFQVEGMSIESGRVFEMAAEPEFEITEMRPDRPSPVEKRVPETALWSFPPASVSAIELKARKRVSHARETT